MIRQLRFGAGSRVRVHHVHGGYRLPEGLPEDAMVVVVRRDGGQVEVEHEGRRFEVALACVDSGFRVIRTTTKSDSGRGDRGTPRGAGR